MIDADIHPWRGKMSEKAGEVATVKIKVLDVAPYRHGVYCTVGDGAPIVNDIVVKDWSEDGESVVFMLETHNFLFCPPDGEMDVVVLGGGVPRLDRDDSDFLSKRPKPSKKCESCHGEGKVYVERTK